MVLLVIVADMDIGAQTDMAAVGRQQLIDDLENGGLAGPVITDQGYMFAPPDLEGEIGKEDLVIEGLGQVLHMHDLAAAFDAGGQDQAHVIPQFHRLFYYLGLLQHLFPALCPADGFFTVEPAQLRDDLLLVTDLGLVVEPCFALLLTQGFFLLCVKRIVSVEDCALCIFQLNDPGHSPVQEIAVMGYDQDRAPVIGQVGLQPADTVHIQMVGGLIQQNDGRLLQQELAQGDPGLLTAGQGGNRLFKILVRESQAPQDAHDLALIAVAALHVIAFQQAGVAGHEGVEGFPFDFVHLPLALGDFLFHIQDILPDGQHLLIDGIGRGQILVLGQVADLLIPGNGHSTAVCLHLTGDDLEQGGLAGPVNTDHSGFFPFFQMEAHIGQDCVFHKCFCNMMTG